MQLNSVLIINKVATDRRQMAMQGGDYHQQKRPQDRRAGISGHNTGIRRYS